MLHDIRVYMVPYISITPTQHSIEPFDAPVPQNMFTAAIRMSRVGQLGCENVGVYGRQHNCLCRTIPLEVVFVANLL